MINPQVPGTGVDAVNGKVSFNNITENQRASLLLVGSEVYVAFANHGFNPPYHGWVLGVQRLDAPPGLGVQHHLQRAERRGLDGRRRDRGRQPAATCSSRPATGPSIRTQAAATTATRCSSSRPSGGRQRLLHAVQLPGSGQRRHRPRLRRRDPAARPARAAPARGDRRRQGRHDLPRRPRQHGPRRHQQRQPDRPVAASTSSRPAARSTPATTASPRTSTARVYYAPVDGPVMAFTLTNGLLSTSPTSESAAIFNGKTSTFSARGGETAISANGNSNGILWALQSNGDSTPGHAARLQPGQPRQRVLEQRSGRHTRPAGSVAEVHDPAGRQRPRLRRLAGQADRLRAAAVAPSRLTAGRPRRWRAPRWRAPVR